MDKVTYITVNEIEYAIIDRGNGEYTSMTRAFYDEQQAALSTPIATDEPATKSK
jgi:hypothetical protein